jgi:hypothetical protein
MMRNRVESDSARKAFNVEDIAGKSKILVLRTHAFSRGSEK